ncbi:MAG: hypothetical protein KIT38_03250 [Gemmatimonadaceae bacterium]|nr:hypothetical protein [Gemmatimonadaceae bacterium]
MSPGTLSLVAVAAPVLAGLAATIVPRKLAGWVALPAAAVAVWAAASILRTVLGGVAVEQQLFALTPALPLAFRVDALGVTFAMLAAGLWLVASVYAAGYAEATKLKHPRRFFAAFAVSIACATGVAFAGDLLTFFVFYELLTVATYPLVVHQETARAYAAGRRYLLFALGGGLALLVAVIWTWQATGTLAFRAGGMLADSPVAASGALLALFLLGVAVKAAVMPFHAWLPGAMVAPTPVSALLHAVAVVKAGVFGLLRVVGFVFGPDAFIAAGGRTALMSAALLTIIAGSVIALRQEHLKRRLAYSTIVHLSYIALGAALATPAAFAGATIHLVNHGLAKITLFFAAGSIYAATKAEGIGELAGLGRRMPWTFGAFTIAAIALMGIPGLAGFPGKLLLARGAVEADAVLALLVLLGASVFTAAYLLPILRIAYFPDAERIGAQAKVESRWPLVLPLALTALATVLFGWWSPALDVQAALADAATQAVFGVGR